MLHTPHLGLDPVQETSLLTLYARALDSRAPAPILGDTLSAEIADRIDYDFARLKLKPSLVASTALRARKLDDIVRRFVTAHPTPSCSIWAAAWTRGWSAAPRRRAWTGTTSTCPS
jgi:hypothetical protein